MGRDLIVFGEDWGAHPSATQHLVTHLARDRRVLWVNSIGLRRPRLGLKDVRRAFGKLAQASGRGAPARVPEGIEVLPPLAIPWPGSAWAHHANRALLRRQIAPRIAALNRPILWASLPTALAAAEALELDGLVYYCGDDFAALDGVDHAPVAGLERRLAARADIVFAASEALARRFSGSRAIHLPHGVDAGLFARAAPRPSDLPEGGPVAGFYGSLSAWLDLDLIAGAADALPNWHFVLIGPERTDLSALKARANIHLLGPRDHAALAGYVQHWDVSMIPFRDTPQIRACNPLKLREYLAAGTPVAATDFPALKPYRDLVSVHASARPYADTLKAALATRDGAEERRRRVAAESWAARAREAADVLEAL
jgi:glycosyltransferase involved in cell wall biosynthesis